MRRAQAVSSLLAAIAIFALGAETDHYLSEHPKVTVESRVENPNDILTATRICEKTSSWHVTLKADEPLTLELLTCPKDFHPESFKENDDGWPWPVGHQLLLLERRGRWRTDIVTALFSDLNFRHVEPGRLDNIETDVVLWSYTIKCGSCHGGPEGILAWNNTDKLYEWNATWQADKSHIAALDAVLPENYYLDEADSLSWTEDRSGLYLQSAVHTAEDSHCCPLGGSVIASVHILDGKLKLSDVSYRPPVPDLKK